MPSTLITPGKIRDAFLDATCKKNVHQRKYGIQMASLLIKPRYLHCLRFVLAHLQRINVKVPLKTICEGWATPIWPDKPNGDWQCDLAAQAILKNIMIHREVIGVVPPTVLEELQKRKETAGKQTPSRNSRSSFSSAIVKGARSLSRPFRERSYQMLDLRPHEEPGYSRFLKTD